MMAVGGFYGPQTVTHLARQTDADLNTVTDNAPASHDQTGCGLLLVWAIRQAIWSKELRACMIGKRYLIDRGDLDRFITLDGVSGCRDLLASGLCFLGFFE